MLLTDARCMRITSKNGSRLMYQPGQAPPGAWTGESPVATRATPKLVSARPFFVGSVAGTSGGHCSAIFEDCTYAWPHMMAGTQAAESRPAAGSVGRTGGRR